MSDSRVLIIDDEEGVRTSLGLLLGDEGFEVTSAANAEEALALARRHAYEYVLCDVRMPERSGLELLPDLVDALPEATVIMMSAYGDVDQALRMVLNQDVPRAGQHRVGVTHLGRAPAVPFEGLGGCLGHARVVTFEDGDLVVVLRQVGGGRESHTLRQAPRPTQFVHISLSSFAEGKPSAGERWIGMFGDDGAGSWPVERMNVVVLTRWRALIVP